MGPSGSNGIFNAAAFWADGDELAVVVLTNRAQFPAEGPLIRGLIRSLDEVRELLGLTDE